MANKLNIEEYRKNKKKRKIKKNLIAFVSLVLIIGLSIVVFKTITNNVKSEKDGDFPISLSGDLYISSQNQGNNMAILTDKELLFYSTNGKKLKTLNHSFKSPAISSSNDATLLYDTNSNNFLVESLTDTILEKSLNNNIFLGKLAPNGNIAIVTNDSKYACVLNVYDKKGNEIYKWYSAENLITSIEFTNDGNGCILSTVGVLNSMTNTTIYNLQFSKKNEVFHTDIEGKFALGVDLIGGFYHVVTDEEIVVVDQKGSIIKTVEFDKPLKQFIFASKKYTVVLLGEDVKSNTIIRSYDQNGNQVGEGLYQNKIKRIASDGSHIVTLSDTNITTNTMTLKEINNYGDKQNSIDIFCCGQLGFDISSTYINRFRLS